MLFLCRYIQRNSNFDDKHCQETLVSWDEKWKKRTVTKTGTVLQWLQFWVKYVQTIKFVWRCLTKLQGEGNEEIEVQSWRDGVVVEIVEILDLG